MFIPVSCTSVLCLYGKGDYCRYNPTVVEESTNISISDAKSLIQAELLFGCHRILILKVE